MDQLPNLTPTAATEEPAVPATSRHPLPACRISDRLAESPLAPARDARGHARRGDGWTPGRIRLFLDSLAECGVVADACRAAGMTRQSAYAFRNRASGRAFHLAWSAAEQLGRRRLAGEIMSRALNGCVEVIVRGDEVIERHRFDNRHAMAMLTRLDQRAVAGDAEARAARAVAEEFDQFVDIVCAGGEGAAAFVERRLQADPWEPAPEARALERCANYARYGVGHPEEIDVSDLDPETREGWTAEQRERAERSGLLGKLEAAGTAPATEPAEDEDRRLVATVPGNDGGPDFRLYRPRPADPLMPEPEPETSFANRSATQTEGDDALPPGSSSEAVAPDRDAESPPAEAPPEPPEPASAGPSQQATCLPEQYDPRSGLLPPDGWIPPKR